MYIHIDKQYDCIEEHIFGVNLNSSSVWARKPAGGFP